MSNEQNTNFSPSKAISNGKDLVALLRDLSLIVVFLMLLIFPEGFNSILTNAGFEEGSVLNFKWKNSALKSNAELQETSTQLAMYKLQTDSLKLLITQIQQKVTDPVVKQELKAIEKKSEELTIATSKTQASVRKTISLNAPLIKKAQLSITDNTQWGVVYGGDTTLDNARFEVKKMAKIGIANSHIYFRNGSYRSVVIASSREEAGDILSKIKPKKQDAYIILMRNWCPNAFDKNGYSNCAVE